ncbi:MAG TPA: hypothetical protein VJ486_05720 [Geothrix sp.]|nr:hypothetical protein [Geothrix sp.]
MKAALLAFAALGLAGQTQPAPPSTPGGLPLDSKDHQPLLLGPATAKAILDHRPAFRENLGRVKLPSALLARWQAIRQPFTLVAVFGSWCGDSRDYLPGLLALDAEPNPFIEVHYLGVNRDKVLADALWPQGCAPRQIYKVPAFYLYAPQPGGAMKLVGTVLEEPPRPKQTMAEALVEMVETALH